LVPYCSEPSFKILILNNRLEFVKERRSGEYDY